MAVSGLDSGAGLRDTVDTAKPQARKLLNRGYTLNPIIPAERGVPSSCGSSHSGASCFLIRGFRVQGLHRVFGDWGLGFRVQGVGFWGL